MKMALPSVTRRAWSCTSQIVWYQFIDLNYLLSFHKSPHPLQLLPRQFVLGNQIGFYN